MCKLKELKYLELLINLNKLHKSIFGDDKSIEVPSLFSEKIIRKQYNLTPYKSNNRYFDATDNKGRNYEIKSTSSEKGTTTINIKHKPDCLIWAYFDFNNEQIVIKKIEGYNNKKTLSDILINDAIKNITIKKDKEMNVAFVGTDLFDDYLDKHSGDRKTIDLNNFKWDGDIIILSMKTLKKI